jgi:mannosyltransferase
MTNKVNSKIFFVLLLILVLGIFLRFHDLGKEALWTDEIISLSHANKPFPELIESITSSELNPPGYFLFLKFWKGLFGDSEFSLRFPSATLDFLSIILIFIIGSSLFNQKVGLLSALILATTMLQIVYAQEARNFATFGFLFLLATTILILNYKKRRTYYDLAYITVMSIAIYFSYMAYFALLIHLIGIIYVKNKNLMDRFLRNVLFILLLGIPHMRLLITQSWLRHTSLRRSLIGWGVPTFLGKLGAFFFILPLLIILVSTAVLYLLNKKFHIIESLKRRQAVIFFLLGIFILVQVFLFSTVSRSFSLVRHTFFIIPFFYLLTAWVITSIKSKKLTLVIVLFLLLFNLTMVGIYYQTTTKAPWGEVVKIINENSQDNVLILFDRSGSNIKLFKYYDKEESRLLSLTWSENRKLKRIDENKLFKKLDKEEKFWLISSRNVKTKDYYLKLIEGKYNLVLSKELKEVKMFLYSGNKVSKDI